MALDDKTPFYYYYSIGGNTRRFVRKLDKMLKGIPVELQAKSMRGDMDEPVHHIVSEMIELYPDHPHIVFTPSYPRNNGESVLIDPTPQPVRQVYDLIEYFGAEINGTVVFGNRTFGPDFCAAAEESPLPVLRKVELGGEYQDVRAVAEQISRLR